VAVYDERKVGHMWSFSSGGCVEVEASMEKDVKVLWSCLEVCGGLEEFDEWDGQGRAER
jgi:hypothetical protein